MSLKILNFYAGGLLECSGSKGEALDRNYSSLMELIKDQSPQIVVIEDYSSEIFPAGLKAGNFQVLRVSGSSNLLALAPSIVIKRSLEYQTCLVQRKHLSCSCSYQGFNFQLTYAQLDIDSPGKPQFNSKSLGSVQRNLLYQLISTLHNERETNLVIGKFNLTRQIENPKLHYLVWDWKRAERLYHLIFERDEVPDAAHLEQLSQCSINSQASVVFPLNLKMEYPL